jgi:hypothetical protein
MKLHLLRSNRKENSMCKKALWALLAIMVLDREAYAYLDPGTGSYIVQIIAGSILVVTTSIGFFWGHIKQIVGSFFKKKEDK